MPIVRVSEPAVVLHPEDGTTVALVPNVAYDAKDPLVRSYPWAFKSDVERATAAPGEKRSQRG